MVTDRTDVTNRASTLIDSHCHLNYDFSPQSTQDLLAEAEKEGIQAFVTIGTDVASIPELQRLSESYSNVFHTVGVHPHEAVTLNEEGLRALESAGRHAKCRGIGEIGLDYHYDHSPRDRQLECLQQQLELAIQLDQPVIIHSREGEEELLSALAQYTSQVSPGVVPGVIHCFSGTLDFGKKCLDLGFFISFSGILTFKKADEVQAAARAFPLDRLMVETDAPYLAPVPYRGKKCHPSMVKQTALKLAELKGVPFEEVARMTTANSKLLFRI